MATCTRCGLAISAWEVRENAGVCITCTGRQRAGRPAETLRVKIDTGVFIRGQRKGANRWEAMDIGDPTLRDGDVIAWLVQNQVNDFGVRLIGVLLGRDMLRRVGL